MANGGSLGGVKVLGKKGWDALHAEPTAGTLGFTPDPMYFTQVGREGEGFTWWICSQGGVAEFRDKRADRGPGRAGYFGWLGYGGSVFQWLPRHKIGFAYAPTVLEFHCMYNRKGARLQVTGEKPAGENYSHSGRGRPLCREAGYESTQVIKGCKICLT